MFCPKCGAVVPEQDQFCRRCGNKFFDKHEPPRSSYQKSNTSIIFLAIGVSIAVLICIISIALYGKVYFFDGFQITAIAWVLAIVSVIIGACAFAKEVASYGFSDFFAQEKSRFFTALILIAAIPAIFLFSSLGKPSSSSNGNSGYYDNPQYYQDTFESCHSTYEHKQAIYSYDLDNDNTISEYEMELFLKAHPKATNDKQFMAWLKSRVE